MNSLNNFKINSEGTTSKFCMYLYYNQIKKGSPRTATKQIPSIFTLLNWTFNRYRTFRKKYLLEML